MCLTPPYTGQEHESPINHSPPMNPPRPIATYFLPPRPASRTSFHVRFERSAKTKGEPALIFTSARPIRQGEPLYFPYWARETDVSVADALSVWGFATDIMAGDRDHHGGSYHYMPRAANLKDAGFVMYKFFFHFSTTFYRRTSWRTWNKAPVGTVRVARTAVLQTWYAGAWPVAGLVCRPVLEKSGKNTSIADLVCRRGHWQGPVAGAFAGVMGWGMTLYRGQWQGPVAGAFAGVMGWGMTALYRGHWQGPSRE